MMNKVKFVLKIADLSKKSTVVLIKLLCTPIGLTNSIIISISKVFHILIETDSFESWMIIRL